MTTGSTKINNNTEIKVTRHENGEAESETSYVNGKKHGMETWWWDNGQKRREVMWKDGKKHGMNTKRWEDGSKWREQMYRAGKEHGMEIGWYEDGQKRYEAHYLDHEVYAEIEWDERGNAKTLRIPEKAPSKAKPIGKSKIISKGKRVTIHLTPKLT